MAMTYDWRVPVRWLLADRRRLAAAGLLLGVSAGAAVWWVSRAPAGTLHAHAQAGRTATLSLSVTDLTGRAVPQAFQICEARCATLGRLELTLDDLEDPHGLLVKLSEPGDKVSQYLHDALAPELARRWPDLRQLGGAGDRAGDASQPVRQFLVDVLNDVLGRDGFFDEQRFGGVNLKPDTRELIDARKKNADSVVVGQLNRYLFEDTYPELIASTRGLSVDERQAANVSVGPGSYWIVPSAFPLLARRITLTAGEHLDVIFTPDVISLKVRVAANQPPASIAVTLKPVAERRRALARLRLGRMLPIALPRPDATRESARDALAVARKTLERLPSEPETPPGSSDEQRVAVMRAYRQQWAVVAHVLSMAGDASDARALVADAIRRPILKRERLAVAAYIESRLGLLDHGALVSVLEKDEADSGISAAIEVHDYGSTRADGKLVAYVRQPADPYLGSQAAAALLDASGDDVREAMRAAFQRPADSKAGWEGHVAAALYLLAWGGKTDLERVTAATHDVELARYLAYLTNDPQPVGDLLVVADRPLDVAFILPALRDLPADRAAEVAAHFQDALFSRALAQADPTLTSTLKEDAAFKAVRPYRMLATFAVPDADAARLFQQGRIDALDYVQDVNWIPEVSRFEGDLVARFAKGQASPTADALLDFIPHDKLVADFQSAGGQEAVPWLDAYLARHQVASRQFYPMLDPFHDGVERRPFVLLDKDGAISGIIEVRVWFVERLLKISVRFDLAPYYANNSFLPADPSEYTINKFMLDGGRSLVGALRLERNGTAVPLRAAVAANGGPFVYEAPVERPDMTGLYLDVKLSWPESQPHFVFDLFAGDYARSLRRLGERLEESERRARDQPADAARWIVSAQVLQSMGQFDEARERYEKAIALLPDNRDVWFTEAGMYASYGLHDKASDVLTALARAHRDEVRAWRSLAGEQYLAGSYDGCVRAASTAQALAASDETAVLQSMCLYLSGDARAANDALAKAPDGPARIRALPLWYVSARTANDAAVQARRDALSQQWDALQDAKAKAVVGVLLERNDVKKALESVRRATDQARAHCYGGYVTLWAGNKDAAKEQFTAAVATGEKDLLEYRMAEAELRKLGQ